MSSSAEIMAELQTLSGTIARARDNLASDSPLDLAPLEDSIEDLCGRIEQLPAAEGRAVQTRLLALVDDFGRLAESIEQKMEVLKGQMGDAAGRRLAVDAYSKSPGPQK
jgi:hypothetical protein